MGDEVPVNYQALIDRKASISTILIEDAMINFGSGEDRAGSRSTLKPKVSDPKLNFVVDTVILANELLPEILLENPSELDILALEEKEARLVGYMAREALARFKESYPSFPFDLSDIVHDGYEHPDPTIKRLVEERAPLMLKAIDIAADSFDRMIEIKKRIY